MTRRIRRPLAAAVLIPLAAIVAGTVHPAPAPAEILRSAEPACPRRDRAGRGGRSSLDTGRSGLGTLCAYACRCRHRD